MKAHKIYIQNIVFTLCFFSCTSAHAQNLDIRLLRNINPQHPNSFIWKGATYSAYPAGMAAPVALWADGAINHNKKTKYKAYELAGSVIFAAGATEAMKIAFNRKRPFEKYDKVYPYKYETGHSFPSGHAAIAFATATSVSLEYKKWYVVVPAYVWATGVGYSRLYLGEHYPTDVIGAAVTGAGSAVISHWISKKILK